MFYMFVMTSTATFTCYIVMYLIWGIYLQFLLPLPFIGFVNGYICTVVLVVGFWYQISYHLRTNLVFRKRLKAYFCYWVVESSIPFQTLGIQLMMPKLGPNIEWINLGSGFSLVLGKTHFLRNLVLIPNTKALGGLRKMRHS